jgi:two-component system cell cycle sensor histidine kinase/response regulator CckA
MKTENQNIPSDLLVVEDDVGLNHLIRKTMERKGFRTRQALSGAEALKALRENPETILLLDYLLPDMNARELINALHKENIAVPLIIMTGHGDEQIAVDMMKLGARDYIVKKAGFIDDLPNVIHHALRELSMEDELRQSEQKFRNYIERAPDGVFMVDATGRYMEVNNAACRITGYSREEILNMSVHDLVAGESSEDGLAHFKKVMETDAAMSDLWHKHKDGSSRCLTINAVKLSETKVLGFAKDITERKRTEVALRQSEERWRLLVQTIPDYVALHDREGRFEYLNRYAAGYSEKDVIGKSLYDFVSAESKELFRKKFEECMKEAKIVTFEHRAMGDNGVMCNYDNYIVPIKQHDAVVKVMVVSRDITERKQAMNALQESEARYRLFFNSSTDGILIADLETRIFKYANPAMCRMLGYTENELITMSVADIHPKEALPSVIAEFEAQARGEKTLAAGLPCLRKDGTVFSADVNAVKILIDGKICNAGFFSDITERKQAEEERRKLEDQLRQSQKLESIGQLSSGVAHDFNNLLGGIMGHAELLKMELNPESPLLRHPEVIISSCVKAADLTRQLLTFARKAPVELQKIDLNAFLKQVVGLMDRTIDRRIEIVTELQEQAAYISGDRNLLENALLNIAINARDAMPGGGHLCITLKTVDLNKTVLADEHFEVVEGPYAGISIADTGTGMSKEIKERIFEPFFTTKEVGKGTGLGLASVYGCVKQHNGYITVKSQVGKGTQFDLYFPIASSTAPVSSPKGEVLMRGKGTLLVVDDEPVYHEILTEIFTGLGYTVHCCANGVDAVDYYREHASAIHVVILDMNMPKMNGLRCFKHLKEINPGVQVVISSGYGDNSDRAALQKEGVRAFVQKPYKAVVKLRN